MPLTWGDWLRFIVTPLVIAAITAIVATRNAKKTPHERLKNLVEIHKNMPAGLDLENVVEGAIARELVDFDRRLAADQRGLWAGIRERLAQLRSETVVTVIGGVGALAAYATGLMEQVDSWGTAIIGLTTILVSSIGLFAAVRASLKSERSSLNSDRATAEIKAHFPRLLLQEVSRDGELSISSGDYRLKLAERLADMGIFEKVIVPREPVAKEQLFTFVLTEDGKRVWNSAFADLEREHLAHWEDIAAENRQEEGDDDPGLSLIHI